MTQAVLQLRTIQKIHGIRVILSVPMVRIMITMELLMQMTSAVPTLRTMTRQIQSPSVRTDLIMITTDS